MLFYQLSSRYSVLLPIGCMLILCSPITVAQAQPLSAHETELKQLAESQHLSVADEKRWLEDFKVWANAQPPEVFRGGLENKYREHLAAEGLGPDQINVRYGSIIKTRQDDQQWRRISVNKAYEAGWYEGVPPSKSLAEFVEGKSPGTALDCGMGAGRNAVFLASLGWDVTGVEVSDVAVKRAEELAAKARVKIHAVRSLYEDFDWGKNRWDLILNIGSWDYLGETKSTFSKAPLAAALKPGGVLYVEGGALSERLVDWERTFMESLFPGVHAEQRLVKVVSQFRAGWPNDLTRAAEPQNQIILTVRKPGDAKQ